MGSKVLFTHKDSPKVGVVVEIIAEKEKEGGALKQVKFFVVRGEDGLLYYPRRENILKEIDDEQRAA